MEDTAPKKSETSIMDIVRLLLSKIKLLILVLVVGCVVGAAFGFLRTYDVKYYGTELKFYINPSKETDDTVISDSQYGVYGAYGKNVMNNMVELLSSEAFAEKIILDENELPPKERLDALKDDTLNELVADTTSAMEKEALRLQELQNALDELNAATKTLNEKWEELRSKDSSLPSSPVTGKNDEADDLISEKYAAQKAYDDAYKPWKTATELTESSREKTLDRWRSLDATYYNNQLKKTVSAVKYSYYDETADVNVDDLARSFIYVNISILNGEQEAIELREKLIERVPTYIEEKMPIPSGYDGTNCIRISRIDKVHQTNSGVVAKTAAKYGLILGFAALVVAAIVIIIVDRSDKRLRNIEQISDTFNIPVLGIIPTFKESQRVEEETVNDDKTTTEVQA